MNTTDAASSTKDRKGVVIRLRMWAEKKETGWIRIRMAGPGKPLATVTNDPKSERYNRILFRNLRQRLIVEGQWPFGEEGAEKKDAEHQEAMGRTEPDHPPTVESFGTRFRPIRAKGGASASEIVIRDRGRF